MKILRLPEVSQLVGLSRSTIFRLEKLGLFPRKRRIAKKSIGWLFDEIDEWTSNLKGTRSASTLEADKKGAK